MIEIDARALRGLADTLDALAANEAMTEIAVDGHDLGYLTVPATGAMVRFARRSPDSKAGDEYGTYVLCVEG